MSEGFSCSGFEGSQAAKPEVGKPAPPPYPKIWEAAKVACAILLRSLLVGGAPIQKHPMLADLLLPGLQQGLTEYLGCSRNYGPLVAKGYLTARNI